MVVKGDDYTRHLPLNFAVVLIFWPQIRVLLVLISSYRLFFPAAVAAAAAARKHEAPSSLFISIQGLATTKTHELKIKTVKKKRLK